MKQSYNNKKITAVKVWLKLKTLYVFVIFKVKKLFFCQFVYFLYLNLLFLL